MQAWNVHLLALGLVTPWFLWAGALLVSVPILIHFLNRRRYKTVQWAAMDYLLQALRKNRRRIRFEQMLLLAVRCSILLLLGLALARPLGCTDSSLAKMVGQRAGLHIFIIDNSYSMAYEAGRPGAATHLDQAKKLAIEQIDALGGGGDSVAIIAAAAPGSATTRPSDAGAGGRVVFRPGYDLDAARLAVQRIGQSHNATDMAGAIQEATAIARERRDQPQKFLYLLTDFTRSAWDAPRESELLRQAGSELPQVFGHRIRIHDLARKGQWNYALLGVRPDSPLVSSTFHNDFLADAKGFGEGPQTTLQWRWDDQVLPESATLVLEPQTPLQRQTRLEVGGGGVHVLSASLLNDEALKADNTRWRTVQVASDLKVLIVEGSRGAGMLSGSGAYLDLSLAPKKEMGPGGHIRSSTYVVPEVISDLELNNKVLGDYRALILTDVASVNDQQAERIARFVEAGGTLMLFMGEQVNAEVYNALLLPRRLLPGKLIVRKTTAADASAYTFDFNPAAPPHTALDIFRGEEKSGLDTARIFTYYQIDLEQQSAAEVVLRYRAVGENEADPAITIHPLGGGRVVTFTTTADAQWNSLPPKPAYIPLIHELLAGAVDTGDRWMNLTVGQAVQVPASLRLETMPTLRDSAGKPLPLEMASNGFGQTTYVSAPIEMPGLYVLSTGAQTFPISVNIPAGEADIRLLPAEAVRKALGDIEATFLGDSIPPAMLARDDRNDLGWPIMLIVLGLVVSESVLAMRFGHYRRSTVKSS